MIEIVMVGLFLSACTAGGSVQHGGVNSSVGATAAAAELPDGPDGPDAPGVPGVPDVTARPDRRVMSDNEAWELRVWYRAKGTRSEGQHGVLRFEGRELEPPEIGAERDTGLGRMRYYGPRSGPLGDRMPWTPTGWNYADPTKMKPSSWIDPR